MNVFDILGPVMIGPSSSHTAGAARNGRDNPRKRDQNRQDNPGSVGSAGREGRHFPSRLFCKDL